MKITELIIKNSLFLNLVTLCILLFGTSVALQTNREAFPAISFDTVIVRTVYPGASPENVESYVTNPLERELENINGIEEMTSSSRQGVSSIVIKIDPDLQKLRQSQEFKRWSLQSKI